MMIEFQLRSKALPFLQLEYALLVDIVSIIWGLDLCVDLESFWLKQIAFTL